ncbi:class II fructose-1,6-bisphosphate aldolase [Lactobacillus iners]|mgnify:CR=1 FL=1|jgi:fructose-1,6-bisphosphate aldolase, class II|uniref:Fructose-1,6-bisphosphate aldolase, class II n=3 Tax=Lactobacillus iners TaxID=147802 RepID=C8PCW6_9LACO|nr:class II fructose-1,6-bisphosphate aldolase [Lactobacillus iners]EFO66721.1 fructose-1,6-bisphosphate aldolase, class II [Lactobacillus iners LactinV 11V1-d]EFO67548.1 fructose-1,6-bisphosphate aldolase, class II [Lactobacillus iners LactinV 09V1-c]EFO69147.1 fructose-1,6-bisphosphate aldolase, class II [Lactobacillus iners LactinV 03V1-b]EFO70725.1 fructose-1,6-bisphosphate aldolase, class II [Lactobacillus iners LactinV 01V1-a]EFO71677.1 fructose-1,6-bisphosphate aldolase, class II [Lacto
MAYLVNGNDIFKAARKNHYAVGAYNTNNLEWTRALIKGAKETRTPLLIQVSTGAAKYMGGYKTVRDLVLNEMDNMDVDVPVILNLDHGDYESAKECIALGYSSVMFDGHKLPVEENLEKTKEIVKLAHERGISVEAEIGKIGENQGADGGELASVEDAKRFVAAGVDKLACGIGNIHGVYPADWKGLNFDRLKEIADAVDVPLVLHGGSGIPQDQIKKAISLGIAKININTEFQLAFQEATRKYIEAEKDLDKANKGYDPRKLLRAGTDAITESMKEMISWMGTRPIDGKDSVVKFDEASLNEE